MSNLSVPTPYDEYLKNHHFLTQSFQLDDTKTNKLIVNWYLPGEKHPEIYLTRLINPKLSGGVSMQDSIQIGIDRGYVELSAEFSDDGVLLKSPEYDDEDEYFNEIVSRMGEIIKIDGSRLSMVFNNTEPIFLYSQGGEWHQRKNREGSIPRLEEKGLLR